MALSNFQDVVVLASDTLSVRGEAIVLGTDAGAKSFIFQNDQFQQVLAANPTANRTISLPDTGGTVGLVTGIAAAGGTVSNGQLSFANSNNVTLGINGSTLTMSVTTAALTQVGGIAAGTQTATSGTIVLSNAQNISWGMSNSSIITASAAFGGIAAGTQTGSASTIVLSNSNNISFGMSGSTRITASAAFGGVAAGTQTGTASTILFSNLNNISFGMNNSSVITASAAFAGLAAGTQTGTASTVILSNSNGVSFGMSNSSVITASVTQARSSFYDNAFNQSSFSTSGSWQSSIGIVGNIGGSVTSKITNPMQLYRLAAPALLAAQTLLASHSMSAQYSGGFQGAVGAQTHTVTLGAGLGAAVYTINGSTAGLVSSVLSSSTMSTSNSVNGISVFGPYTVSFSNTSFSLPTWSFTPGDYMLGLMSFVYLTVSVSSVSINGDGITAAQGFVGSSVFTGFSDSQFRDGLFTTSASGVFPATFHVTNITDNQTYQWFRLYGT